MGTAYVWYLLLGCGELQSSEAHRTTKGGDLLGLMFFDVTQRHSYFDFIIAVSDVETG